MRIYVIGNDGIKLCREPLATVTEGEIAVTSKEELQVARLSSKRLLGLWNARPGVEKRKKVGDRACPNRRKAKGHSASFACPRFGYRGHRSFLKFASQRCGFSSSKIAGCATNLECPVFTGCGATRVLRARTSQFRGYCFIRITIGVMSAKRSHSPIEFQKGVGAQCRFPNEARPVRGDDFLYDRMVHRHEAGARKMRPDLIGGRQVGVEHGTNRGEKVRRDDIVFAGPRADANVTTDPHDTPAFSRHCKWIRQMVIDL
jgi:hypothetical protein